MLNALNTIVAISTAFGAGGIGIVRISGQLALKIGEQVSRSSLVPRVASFHSFKDSQDNLIDQGLILFFPAPNSFTGEDISEEEMGEWVDATIDIIVSEVLFTTL